MYDGPADLGEELWQRVGRPLGMPHLENTDLKLLDEAISILNPPEVHVRVVEVDTFMVRAITGRGAGAEGGGLSGRRFETRQHGSPSLLPIQRISRSLPKTQTWFGCV